MPVTELNEPQLGKDVPWEDKQWFFRGAWMPGVDGALIGPDNFSILQNLRYNETGLEGVNGYSKINTTPITTFTKVRDGYQLRVAYPQATYTLLRSLNSSDLGRVYENRTAIGEQGDFEATHLHEDNSAELEAQFAEAPQANVAYCNGEESMIYAGDEYRFGAVFSTVYNTEGNPIEQSDNLSNNVSTLTYTYDGGDQRDLIVMATRPLMGVKVYIDSANVGAGTMLGYYWNGSAWAAVGNIVDGTEAGGKTLVNTGFITWDDASASEKPKHFQELFMYAYKLSIAATTSAVLTQITVKPPWQDIIDIWDGVYRQPIQAQYNNAGNYEDYTLQVNESSDVATPIGMQLDGLVYATDDVIFGFEQQMSAIRITMLSGLTNTNEGQLTVKYWSGTAFTTVGASLIDGTASDGTGAGATSKSFNSSGVISWNPPAAEKKQTLFGVQGYFYEFTWTDAGTTDTDFSGAKGGDVEVVVDIVTGIPAQYTVQPFKFPALYKNRLMLCNFEAGNEQNRIDYSVSNTPDAWNGVDSSENGIFSLYFGGNTPITAATQLYNRFGSNIFAMFLVLKDSEVYVMLGDSADDFAIYPVSFTLGCPAAMTLATAQVAFDKDRLQTRNVAIWLSYSGPVMFDGAMLSPMQGIENFFDPNENDYIDWDRITDARGWIDRTYNEYNLLFSKVGETTNNVWVVFDLLRRKWFEKSTGQTNLPQMGFNLVSSNGEQFTYGGIDDGTMIYLEDGTSWDGIGIEQRVKTGDFFPSENIWDKTIIRKLKLITKKISSTSSKDLEIRYYGDSAVSDGVGISFEDDLGGVSFVDQTATVYGGVAFVGIPSATLDLSLDVGSKRLITVIDDMNQLALMHAIEFRITTTDVQKGFEPVAWGIRYRLERKDDQAT